ncbi:MAG TPA: hypothetical protein VIJ38_17365 [Acidobacteriaceae bacterium]
MKSLLLLLMLAVPSAAAIGQTSGITVWPKGVPPQGLTYKADFGDHILSISHREHSGRVEIHQTKVDVLVIQSGTATLVSGGVPVDPVRTAPHELQASSIKGGVSRTVGPGDVIDIPIGVPHQFLLTPGTQITYLVVKVVKH